MGRHFLMKWAHGLSSTAIFAHSDMVLKFATWVEVLFERRSNSTNGSVERIWFWSFHIPNCRASFPRWSDIEAEEKLGKSASAFVHRGTSHLCRAGVSVPNITWEILILENLTCQREFISLRLSFLTSFVLKSFVLMLQQFKCPHVERERTRYLKWRCTSLF